MLAMVQGTMQAPGAVAATAGPGTVTMVRPGMTAGTLAAMTPVGVVVVATARHREGGMLWPVIAGERMRAGVAAAVAVARTTVPLVRGRVEVIETVNAGTTGTAAATATVSVSAAAQLAGAMTVVIVATVTMRMKEAVETRAVLEAVAAIFHPSAGAAVGVAAVAVVARAVVVVATAAVIVVVAIAAAGIGEATEVATEVDLAGGRTAVAMAVAMAAATAVAMAVAMAAATAVVMDEATVVATVARMAGVTPEEMSAAMAAVMDEAMAEVMAETTAAAIAGEVTTEMARKMGAETAALAPTAEMVAARAKRACRRWRSRRRTVAMVRAMTGATSRVAPRATGKARWSARARTASRQWRSEVLVVPLLSLPLLVSPTLRPVCLQHLVSLTYLCRWWFVQ